MEHRASQSLPNLNTCPRLSQVEGQRPSMLESLNYQRYSAGHLSYRESVASDHGGKPFQKVAPFNMRWIHGYNHKAGVFNLNDHGSTIAFYAASNCGVLYNWTSHQMHILQGHKHTVTCLARDRTGEWLVTADSGADNTLIVWNHRDLYPERTLFSPHVENKIVNVALSADAKYLLTMGQHHEKLESFELFWWIWSFGLEMPHATIDFSLGRETIVDLDFNPFMSDQFILLCRHSIFIGISRKIIEIERGIPKETDAYELKMTKISLNVVIEEMHERLMCHAFVQKTSQILVATSRGSVLILGYTMEYNDKVSQTAANYEDLKFIKEIKIEKWRINVIKSIDDVIITGNSHGELHFYDDQLKLLYWMHGLNVDGIRGICFNVSPRSYQIFDTKCKKACLCWERVVTTKDPETGKKKQKLLLSKIPTDASTSGKPFLVRDFLISTINQGVCFMDFVTENIHTILDHRTSPIICMSVHPYKEIFLSVSITLTPHVAQWIAQAVASLFNTASIAVGSNPTQYKTLCDPQRHLICLGFADGTVQLFNFLQHKPTVRLNFRDHFTVVKEAKADSINFNVDVDVPSLSVTCLQYSPTGLHLVCGLNTGMLVFLDPTTIDMYEKICCKDTNYAIRQVSFCVDSLIMATADAGKTVCVYKYNCQSFTWDFVGKHRAHYKDIINIMFLPVKNVGGDYKLLSLGKDRLMVEYDIEASSNEYLEILSLDRIEQSAIPLASMVWPSPRNLDPAVHMTDLPLILIATDEYKYKIVNYETTMTLATVLGPRYDSPVSKMQLVKIPYEGDADLRYIAFTTRDVIGLQKMPLDGNPYKHAAMLGHPTKIIGMCFREDLGIMFTIGEKDTSMIHWAANFRSVESSSKLGGVDLDPYYCLIEDQRPGWLFQEIRDLFYYIQILCQGTFSPAIRRVRDYIPIDSLPDLMRALGFFPSEYAVENLLVEAKYKVYLRSPVEEINFEEFVLLYLNHRPAFGESFKRVRVAFKTFADIARDNYVMSRDDFIEMLTSSGECFTRELAWYLLSILSGHSFEDRANMVEGDFSFLPEKVTFSDLVNDIIGMQEMEDLSDTYSHVGSVGSFISRTTYDSEASDDRFGKVFW